MIFQEFGRNINTKTKVYIQCKCILSLICRSIYLKQKLFHMQNLTERAHYQNLIKMMEVHVYAAACIWAAAGSLIPTEADVWWSASRGQERAWDLLSPWMWLLSHFTCDGHSTLSEITSASDILWNYCNTPSCERRSSASSSTPLIMWGAW